MSIKKSVAWENLSNNKIRSVFTIFSVTICIASIIIVYFIVESSKREISKNIKDMGANILWSMPDIYDSYGLKGCLSYNDLIDIKKKCKSVKSIAMLCTGGRGGGSGRTKIMGLKCSFVDDDGWGNLFSGFLYGTIPDFKKIMGLKMREGRFINNIDLVYKRNVCVLGYFQAIQFGKKNLLGKTLKYKRYAKNGTIEILTFTIIGVIEKKGALSLPLINDFFPGDFNLREVLCSRINKGIFIPHATMEKLIKVEWLGDVYIKIEIPKKDVNKNELIIEDKHDYIYIHERVREPANKILKILKEKYGKDKKFHLYSYGRLLDELEDQTKHANIFIGTVGIFSLLASIISILSMMLLSVTNRTNEIGVRRAFGARKRDIFFQFLQEAVVITGKGGIGGIILGLFGVYLLGKYTGWEIIVPWYSLFLSLLAIGSIAAIAGLYPALKAANIPPAIAVKYE